MPATPQIYTPASAMIATLGGKPELVTLALDALLAQGEQIDEVFVLHPSTANPRIHQALQRLQREFSQGAYAAGNCRFQRCPLMLGDIELDDIRNDDEVEATQQSVRALISTLKRQNRKLHLCLAGGRRMMGMLVLSTAALLCDHRDRLWHLHGSEAFKTQVQEQQLLHAPPDADFRLVPIPLVPWGTYFPALRAVAQTPQEAVAGQMEWLTGANDEQCRTVYAQLTERQRDVLVAFAQGLRPKEVADQLVIALATVNSHKTVILDHCRNSWPVARDEVIDYHWLRDRFALFVQRLERWDGGTVGR